ncbi:hypothetical protein [Cohnella algarum]|uniref:hypothetical protein n=1 Tax=Cohnella algarum TaxID=2044859 RepID=UPI00196882E9|nr:hypothetical protein [Cohnella algarum]MBN2982046.1 hypothetical protein [Cohnella algarum]
MTDNRETTKRRNDFAFEPFDPEDRWVHRAEDGGKRGPKSRSGFARGSTASFGAVSYLDPNFPVPEVLDEP